MYSESNELNTNNSTEITRVNETLVLLNLASPFEDIQVKLDNTSDSECYPAYQSGEKALIERESLEKNLTYLERDTPSYRHQKSIATSEKSRNLTRCGFAEVEASKYFLISKGSYANFNLRVYNCSKWASNPAFVKICQNKTIQCNKFQLYRTYNGTCNNLNNPNKFGVAYQPFRRLLPPKYSDGVSEPRKSKSGKYLPSARTVSLIVHRPIYKDDPKFTVMLAVWGQFLDHDITATALSQSFNGKAISCCDENGQIKTQLHPECFPVKLEPFDPYYQEYNVSCMEFVRSAPAPTCRLGPREQLNQASAYIDGSMIYGSDEDVVSKLRSFKNGSLVMMKTGDNRSLLPVSEDFADGCNREEQASKGRYCFAAGND